MVKAFANWIQTVVIILSIALGGAYASGRISQKIQDLSDQLAKTQSQLSQLDQRVYSLNQQVSALEGEVFRANIQSNKGHKP